MIVALRSPLPNGEGLWQHIGLFGVTRFLYANRFASLESAMGKTGGT